VVFALNDIDPFCLHTEIAIFSVDGSLLLQFENANFDDHSSASKCSSLQKEDET
jgi:hypothetical protein